jgi:hypothetical protein
VDADRLAIAVLPGADRQDSRRGRAIVAQTLRTATRDGHTVLPADLVVAALQAEGISDPVAAVVAAVAVRRVPSGVPAASRPAVASRRSSGVRSSTTCRRRR